MERSEKTWMVVAIVVSGLVLAISYHGFLSLALGTPYPSNTFLFRPELRFSDFYDIFGPVQAGSPLGSKSAVYFPFTYVTLYPLLGLSPNKALAIVLAIFLPAVFLFFWAQLSQLSALRRAACAGVLAFCSYPILMCIDRANLEMIVLLFVLAFIYCFETRRYYLSALFLGCATAMKFYPGAFGILLIKQGKYKASVLTALVTLVLTIGAAATFPGGVPESGRLLGDNLQYFREAYVYSAERSYFSASYFSVLKIFARVMDFDMTGFIDAVRLPYVLACAGLFLAVLFYILKYEGTRWKQLALIAVMVVLLPEVSFDYKMIHLLVPLAFFLAAPPAEPGQDRISAILFGLLMVPKAYGPIGSETTIGVVINPLLMTLLMAHIIWTGLRLRQTKAGATPLPA